MSRILYTAEVALWTVAIVSASAVGMYRLRTYTTEQTAVRLVSHTPVRAADDSSSAGGIFGRIEIPALDLAAPMVENSDDQSLSYGVGHVSGTAQPGGLGNFALAAHRDTFFQNLGKVRPGMVVRVVTANETYTYTIDATRVVLPDDTRVLDTGKVPQLTLITCYPFHFIGPAPKRFIVSAHLTTM